MKPSSTNLRVVNEGGCVYVLGTHRLKEAMSVLPAEITGFMVAEQGWYAPRKNGLRYIPPETPVKDSRIGVRFGGLVRDPSPKPPLTPRTFDS